MPTKGVDKIGGMAVVEYGDGIVVKKVAVGDGDAGENFEFGLSPCFVDGEADGAGVNLER